MKPFYIYSLVVLALGNAANACMNGLGDHQRVSKGSVSIKPWFTTDKLSKEREFGLWSDGEGP